MSKIDLKVQAEKGSCVYLRQSLPSCSCWPYCALCSAVGPSIVLLDLNRTLVIWRYFQGCSEVKHPGPPSNSRWCYLQVFFYPPLFGNSTVLPSASSSVSGALLLFLSCCSQTNDSSFCSKWKEPLAMRKLGMGIKNLFLRPDSMWSLAVCVPGVIAEFATKGEEAGRDSRVGHWDQKFSTQLVAVQCKQVFLDPDAERRHVSVQVAWDLSHSVLFFLCWHAVGLALLKWVLLAGLEHDLVGFSSNAAS